MVIGSRFANCEMWSDRQAFLFVGIDWGLGRSWKRKWKVAAADRLPLFYIPKNIL